MRQLLFNEAREFSQGITANKQLNGLLNPVLILNYDYNTNERFRVESIAMIILIHCIVIKQQFICNCWRHEV